MELHTWHDLTPDGSVRLLAYSFGPGRANTLAVRLEPDRWLVISPCAGAPEAALDAIDKQGTVVALVANNGFHHLGQEAWRARFHDAVSYAPEGSLPRLAAKAATIPFRPLSELKLPDHVAMFVPDGMKVPDLMVRVTTPSGNLWFSGDLLSNTTVDDTKAPLRWIFGLFGGGTGFRFNPIPSMVYLKDKAAWKASVRAAMAAHPPAVLVPAHGVPLRDDVASKVAAVLA